MASLETINWRKMLAMSKRSTLRWNPETKLKPLVLFFFFFLLFQMYIAWWHPMPSTAAIRFTILWYHSRIENNPFQRARQWKGLYTDKSRCVLLTVQVSPSTNIVNRQWTGMICHQHWSEDEIHVIRLRKNATVRKRVNTLIQLLVTNCENPNNVKLRYM